MRKHYLDNIKWVTVILVLIFHVVYMYNAEGIFGTLGKITELEVQYYDVFQYAVYPWFMMILFIVSGITSRIYLENHTDKEFIKSRTTKLLVPSTIGLFAFQFIQGYINAQFSDIGKSIGELPALVKYFIMAIPGVGVLWYLQLLWVFCILLILIRKIERDKLWNICEKCNIYVLIALTIVVWLFAQILNTPYITVYRFGYYGISFFLGYFVFSHDNVIDTVKKFFWPLCIVALILGIVFCIKYFGQNYTMEPVNRAPLYTSFAWFASLAVLGGFAKYFDYETDFTRWMSSHSFGLYVFHYLGISAIALFVAKPGLAPSWVCYVLSLIAGFITGYGLYAIISRIPYYRWAVLGIKEPSKN